MSSPVQSVGPLLASIADLSDGGIGISQQSSTLQSGLTALLQRYETREKQYTKAVKNIQDNYHKILIEADLIAFKRKVAADEEAKMIVATAHKEMEAWEAEKARLAVIQKFEPRIKLDVGGERFTTSLTTLTRFPDTMIGVMFSGRHAMHLDADGYYFIDRDGTHFRYILNFLRSPENVKIEISGPALSELKGECEYYGLDDLMFPFTPLADFSVSNPWGQSVTIKQDKNVIFSINGTPLYLCMHCFAANYAHCGITNHSGYFVKDFQSTVNAKKGIISADQPKPLNTCNACRRAQT